MLTSEQKKSFAQSGYVVLRGAFDKDLEPYRVRVQEILGGAGAVKPFVRYGPDGKPVLYKISQLASRDALFGGLASHPKIKAAVEELIGPAQVFRDVLVGKPPRTGSVFHYHQDAAYWDVPEPDRVLSAWIALDDSSADAGCLRFRVGSHRAAIRHDIIIGGRALPRALTAFLRRAVSLTGTGDNPTTFVQRFFSGVKNGLLGGATKLVPALNDLNEISVDSSGLVGQEVAAPVAAGDAVLFHSLLLHASGPNTSSNQRRAYIVTFMGEGAGE